MVIIIFFTLLLLFKHPKNFWMLIPSIILGLVFAFLTVDEFDNQWLSYILVLPFVMLCTLGLLYSIVPQNDTTSLDNNNLSNKN